MARCNEKDIEQRGSSNPQQTEYTNTVADYTTPATGDNVIQSVTCDSSVYVGAVVRISGTTAVNALADSTSNAHAIGVCISKSDATTCNIQVTGFTGSIFSSLDVTKHYFLSSTVAGALTTTPPSASGNMVLSIGTPYTSTQLIVNLLTPIRRS